METSCGSTRNSLIVIEQPDRPLPAIGGWWVGCSSSTMHFDNEIILFYQCTRLDMNLLDHAMTWS